MSPEAILGAAGGSGPAAARLTGGGAPLKVGRASDIWSLGCILYQMVHGRTPFAHLPFIQKMQAIIDPEHAVEYPPLANAALEDVLRRCLERNPRTRATMAELEAHAFLRPTAAAPPTPGGAPGAAGSVELSQEQLRRLLVKVSAAAAAGASGADVGQLSEALFRQLSNGGGLSPEPAPAVARKAAPMPPPMPGAAAKAAAPPPPPGASGMAAAAAAARAAAPRIEPQEQREPAEPSSLATAAAAAATAMADCRAAAAAAPEAAQPAAGRGPLMDISAEAIRAKAAGLRKVGGPSMAPGFQPGATAAPPPPPPPPPPAEGGGVEAALSAGLERFRFDDTRTVAFGEAGGA
jgi:serine/threonine-protein kinase TTK/MPS1